MTLKFKFRKETYLTGGIQDTVCRPLAFSGEDSCFSEVSWWALLSSSSSGFFFLLELEFKRTKNKYSQFPKAYTAVLSSPNLSHKAYIFSFIRTTSTSQSQDSFNSMYQWIKWVNSENTNRSQGKSCLMMVQEGGERFQLLIIKCTNGR